MVQPDFAEEHEAELGISSAFASYMISYDANSFDFRSTVSLAAQGSPPLLFSACEGVIRVTTDEPLLLSAESSFTYSLPSGHRRATYILTAGADGTAYISGFGGADTGFGDPPVGTVEVDDGPILVPGNTTYLLRYTMSLDSLGGDPTVLSHGDGHVHFHLETAPEPMTAGLVLASIPLFARRRARIAR
jgi:hypothetical protein